MHKNRILSTTFHWKILKLKEMFYFIILFFFLQITTHHSHDTSFISPSFDRKIFIGILKPCPTAQPGQVHKDHTTYKTAPVKKDLHVMSLFLSSGDEVANTEQSTVLTCL